MRRIKEGTACVLTQSGLNEKWWPQAMRCYCFQRNAHDLLRTEMSAWKARFGEECLAPMIPFGALIEYKPITDQDKARLHQFGVKTLKGIFIGYEQQAGGGWSKDLLFIDTEELEAAEFVSDVSVKRMRNQEVLAVMDGDSFCFPVAEGDLQQPGEARVVPRRVRNRSRAQPPQEANHDEEAEPAGRDPRQPAHPIEPDFWTLSAHVLVRHHRTPRTKLYTPTDAECPIPLRYVDVMRQTSTDLDDWRERLVQDHWPLDDAGRELSAAWTGKTIFHILKITPPRGYTWFSTV